jgi:hypothetical protein
VRVQALADAVVGAFGGRLDLPMPSYPLTASRVTLSVGVPSRVVPLALLGGDRPAWYLDEGDVAAVLIAFAVAWLAVRVAPDTPRARARRLRLLGGAVLAGLWFVSGGAFVAIVTALVAAGIGWVLARLFRGVKLAGALVIVLGIVGMIGLVMMVGVAARAPMSRMSDVAPSSEWRPGKDATGNYNEQLATGGVLEGVTPVALSMPTYVHGLDASRELVTRDRPFRPALYYVTDRALWPLALLWLAGALVLAAAHRAPFLDMVRRARERLAHEPAAPPAPGEGAPPRGE